MSSKPTQPTRGYQDAFPSVLNSETTEAFAGMTKREYFALHIFAATMPSASGTPIDEHAAHCVVSADRLILALNSVPVDPTPVPK